ncbi:MAG TPA: hypothetical protein DER58_12160, partial [Firmicutes bacterium]|nr:hypothetical protein [Bacillota bacterium]
KGGTKSETYKKSSTQSSTPLKTYLNVFKFSFYRLFPAHSELFLHFADLVSVRACVGTSWHFRYSLQTKCNPDCYEKGPGG